MTRVDLNEPQLLDSLPVGSRAHVQFIKALESLREQAASDAEKDLYDGIISGKRSARDLLSSPEFCQLAERGIEQSQRRMSAMDDEARLEYQRAAEREADRFLEPFDDSSN